MPGGATGTERCFSRRRFLGRGALLLMAGALAACSPQGVYRRNCEAKGLQAGTPAFDQCLAREAAIVERMGRARRSGGP